MIGILVYGDNHFIVEGPPPTAEEARALVQHWSIIRIGAVTPVNLQQWRIVTKAFRENLEWSVVVTAAGVENSAAVKKLLLELEARHVAVEFV